MGVEKTKRQVAQPYSQTSAGSTAIGCFTVGGSASGARFNVTGTAQEIVILKAGNYTVYADDTIYWEITDAPDVLTNPTVAVTAATTSSPILPGGQYFNFYFGKGQEISVIASGTVAFQMLPSVV